MAGENKKDEVTFEIKESLGILSTNEKSGWNREVNRVSWNGGAAKIDIRDWSPDHDKMSKGITLTDAEAKALVELLK